MISSSGQWNAAADPGKDRAATRGREREKRMLSMKR